jgi:hypothetical protein
MVDVQVNCKQHIYLDNHFNSEGEGSTVLLNVSIQPPYYTVQQSKKHKF